MSLTDEQRLRTEVFNGPNMVTSLRLLLSFVVFALIPLGQYAAGLVLFIIAAATDWIDGYWARRTGQVTKLGRMLDPFVDKIIICGAYILLAEAMRDIDGGIVGWMAVVVVGREMLVTALRSLIEQSGGDFSANMAGKLKMVFQCAAVILCLVALILGPSPLPAWLYWSMLASVWLSVISTVYSGLGYIFAAAKFFRE